MNLKTASGGMARPAGMIKSFKSTLRIIEGDRIVREKTIEVNSPVTHRGYTLYQSGYDDRDLSLTILQVVRDPSVPVVYSGFVLMLAGLMVIAVAVGGQRGTRPPALPTSGRERAGNSGNGRGNLTEK